MSRRGAPVHLTRREREIVHLVVEGCSNKEIAGLLRLQCQTVKNQLSLIYDKLGVSTRVQLAVYAVRHGLDGLDDAPEA
jgi:two-component system, NarL family, nitrate/nitrite response regulator NarL